MTDIEGRLALGFIMLAQPFARQVQQTGNIAADQIVGSGEAGIGELGFRHAVGNIGELDAEAAPESATDFGLSHFLHVDVGAVFQEDPGLGLDLHLAQPCAAVMVGNALAGQVAIELIGLPVKHIMQETVSSNTLAQNPRTTVWR